MKITIDHDIIKAFLPFIPKHDIRYYLMGLCVDARQNGDVVLIATTGHHLLALPLPVDCIEDLLPGEYIIPADALRAIKPAKVGRTTLPLTLTITKPAPAPDPERPGVTLKAPVTFTLEGATTATGTPIDGTFPDWRRVTPATTTGEAAAYNADYLADFQAAAQLLTGKKTAVPVVCQSGNNAALVTGIGRGALGVIMPIRADADDRKHPGLPAWATK